MGQYTLDGHIAHLYNIGAQSGTFQIWHTTYTVPKDVSMLCDHLMCIVPYYISAKEHCMGIEAV